MKSSTMLRTCAELWMAGAPIDWSGRYQGERRIKRVLPTYPFERRRYWIVDHAQPAQQAGGSPGPWRLADPARAATPNYFMETVTWRRVQYFNPPGASGKASSQPRWLVFNPTEKIDKRIAAALRQRGDKVTIVEKGPRFQNLRGRTGHARSDRRSRSRPAVQDCNEVAGQAAAAASRLFLCSVAGAKGGTGGGAVPGGHRRQT